MVELRAYQGPEHEPFFWEAGEPAALLVHGFPGTPAEMRPLGEVLHEAGWTVHGVLLPGFGPQIQTLADQQYTDWIDAVTEALTKLRRDHRPILLIGYSMGGAIAVQVAASHHAAGLVLLAPFWRVSETAQHVLWPVLKLIFRELQPFKDADFDDPELRRNMSDFLSGVDLDDPETQQAIRELSIPSSVIDQVRTTGLKGHELAPRIGAPTLVIQGEDDEVVRPELTRKFLARLPTLMDYVEVPAGHALTDADNPAWSDIRRAVLNFATMIQPETIS